MGRWGLVALLLSGIFLVQIHAAKSCFPAIFGFGDDWGDTGNIQALFPSKLEELLESEPYGSTHFGKPAHRLSDGRLMLDFFALALRIPSIESYASGFTSDMHLGLSFAVAGSTAKEYGFHHEFYDLQTQLDWLQKLHSDVDSAANATKQPLPNDDAFHNGLYVISTGLNDYRYALFRDNSTSGDVEKNLLPAVVGNITETVLLLSTSLGVKNFVVMGLPPLGCMPEFLTAFATPNTRAYDNLGCLNEFNRITTFHNELLRLGLQELRATSPNIIRNLIYVDMAALVKDFLNQNPGEAGLRACCGVGGPYNFNPGVLCGSSGVVNGVKVSAGACRDPKQFISWDGVHMTEAFNKMAVDSLLGGRFVDPPAALRCLLHSEDHF